jgi:hypothetical protein
MAIEAGDLVMIVRECHGLQAYNASGIGYVFTVSYVEHQEMEHCAACFGSHTGLFAVSTHEFGNGCLQAPVSWLKKIPPLSELEGKEERELEPVLLPGWIP